ncbi:glycosyl transferase [Desulfocapsa sulfexigens DSM 10523]|uniref:Glycosyl transferase n=1 Tax=Desulfocapsa sulfexigens (strain DSM 10523 / SB164P1) TaxID=1167006 RepID=M1PA68_DESSD|nr:glycosyltransferase [Desulfocapsa sulfexigens]AGF78522.1 glycosyl transferase [Desulfocapsa sulfexigens DSM 10523]
MSDNNTVKPVPFVSLIVPVTGASPVLAENLKTLVNQDYQSFNVIFVLQDENDPATPIITAITKENKRATYTYSGRAISCSQKNHNLLVGVQQVGNKPDILVFCDSGHTAPPDWLDCLLHPLLSHTSCMVSSGYHQIYSKGSCTCSQGRAICVLTLSLIRRLPFLGQPWGGATAIRREVFENISVADTWKENIVDDVSLAKLLQKNNIPVAIPDKTDLKTHLSDLSVTSWIIWLTRQWAYLKFIFPVLWIVTGLLSIVAAISVLASLGITIISLFFPYSRFLLQYSLPCIFLFFLFTIFLYSKHPSPGSFFSWFPASLAALTMAAYCHIRTWFSMVIGWAGIQYRVGKNGKVLSIIRKEIP